jgi:hypothetical protein
VGKCAKCKGWKVVRGAGSRAGLPYTTKHGAETALAPAPCPACTAFIPHEWERDEATRTVTCNVCLVVVRTLAQLENVESCKGPTPEHMRALRDVKLRGNGVLSAE